MMFQSKGLLTRCLPVLAVLLVAPSTAGAQARGQAAFNDNCAACHQENGKGVEGAFPALAGNPFVLGAPEAVAEVVVKGRGGMPPVGADLADDVVADIISFVRSAWGNSASPVAKEVVAKAKAGGAKAAN